MRLKYLLLIVAVAVVGVQAKWDLFRTPPQRSPAATPPAERADVVSGRVSVVDGDTLLLDAGRQRVRLFGIDAPESGQTCLDGKAERYLCGASAAEALAALLGRNSHVECSILDTDRYQRLVAECRTAAGANLNREMVRAGWAVDYERYSHGRYAGVRTRFAENRTLRSNEA